MAKESRQDPFGSSDLYVQGVAKDLNNAPIRLREIDRVCAYKQSICVRNTFHRGITFFAVFILTVFALNALHEFLHMIFITGYGITVGNLAIGLILSNVNAPIPMGLPWWEYIIMIYGPLIVFAIILLVIMWVYPRIDVPVYKGSQFSQTRLRYGKMALRATGIYLSTALLINTALSPVLNYIYQTFVPWYGKTDFGFLWDTSYQLTGGGQFLLQSATIILTTIIAFVAMIYVFSHRIFGKEKVSL